MTVSREELAVSNEQRRRGAGRVLALLFTVCLLVVTGCADLFLDKPGSGGGSAAEASGDMPEGYGAVSIRLTSGAERTATPGNVLGNLHLRYVFTRLVERRPGMWMEEEPGKEMTPDENGIVVLEAGRYRLMVQAFMDETREDLVAEGVPEKDFDIDAGDTVPVDVYLRPAASGGGTGELAFTLEYPEGAAVETLTLTLMPDEGTTDLLGMEGLDELTNGLKGKTSIDAGYYLLQVVVVNSEGAAGRTEVVHIYQGQETKVAYTFAVEDFQEFYVTSTADDGGPGTLRWAIKNALDTNQKKVELLLEPGTEVALESPLVITGDLEIEGNGVILTTGKDWTASSLSQPVRITDENAAIVIRRVHFKDGDSTKDGTGDGGAVNNTGTLTLESCIFSGNVAPNGGAVHSKGDLTIRGCTFYGNSATQGGAVYMYGNGKLTLTGNLFYGNKAQTNPVVRKGNMTVTSIYNVVDVEFGIGDKQAGFSNDTSEQNVKVDVLPVSPVSFRVLEDSKAKDALKEPLNYSTNDFYGNEIKAGGAAGAVQESTADGWYLGITVKGEGDVEAPQADDDGIISKNNAFITPKPGGGQALGYWTVNGVKTGAGADPKSMKITKHSIVEAVFGRKVEVSSEGDLRGALDPTKAKEDDVIVLSKETTITLNGPLPEIKTSVVIEGNGATLTTGEDWSSSSTSQLLHITGGEALIRGVHFKDGKTTNYGGAVDNAGKLTLESCIFSGNQATNSLVGNGGAVRSTNDLTIRGCTFYNNSASVGGAVFFNATGKTLTLTGNVFSGNSAKTYPVVRNSNGTVIAAYNVSDVEFGTSSEKAGWDFVTGNGDTTIQAWPVGLPVSPKTFVVLVTGGAEKKLPATLPEGYPEEDFYGTEIKANGAAGAVQKIKNDRWYLEYSTNNPTMGYFEVTENSWDPDNKDGTIDGGTLTPTAKTGYVLVSWTVNGETMAKNVTSIPINKHIWATAVFGPKPTASSLSKAMEDANPGDVIVVSGVTAGETSITLDAPLAITKSVTIEGNGVVLERDTFNWTEADTAPLLSIGAGAEVTIRGVQFTGGGHVGRAVDNAGKLTLDSCIFAGNEITSEYDHGGAVDSSGELTIRGCTFYNNKVTASGRGGAVYFHGNNLILTGNLFYGNSAPLVYSSGNIGSSYNVADVNFGLGNDQTGFAGGTENQKIDGTLFDTTSFVPVDGLKNVISTKPADFPATDFYGTVRTFPGAVGAVAKAP
jgi:predicted outer membrane repeat protein